VEYVVMQSPSREEHHARPG